MGPELRRVSSAQTGLWGARRDPVTAACLDPLPALSSLQTNRGTVFTV